MYKIKWNDPLGSGERNSIIEFFIGDKKYFGKIHEDNRKWFIYSFTDGLLHEDFVDLVFKPLGMSPKEYYKHVLGPDFGGQGKWPVAYPEDLGKVLINMKRDYEKINESEKKSILDFSKFRFKIGDIILYKGKSHRIVGYYFSSGFNNFKDYFGYVIKTDNCWHDGSSCGYDEYGNHLPSDGSADKYYIQECEVEPSSESQLTSNNQLKIKENGNAIKLQRTKAFIRRGKVPAGSRICSKIHKAAVSSQHLGYKQVIG